MNKNKELRLFREALILIKKAVKTHPFVNWKNYSTDMSWVDIDGASDRIKKNNFNVLEELAKSLESPNAKKEYKEILKKVDRNIRKSR